MQLSSAEPAERRRCYRGSIVTVGNGVNWWRRSADRGPRPGRLGPKSFDSIVCGSGRWLILHVNQEIRTIYSTDTVQHLQYCADTDADTDANSRDVLLCYTIARSELQGDVLILDWSQPPGTARLALPTASSFAVVVMRPCCSSP